MSCEASEKGALVHDEDELLGRIGRERAMNRACATAPQVTRRLDASAVSELALFDDGFKTAASRKLVTAPAPLLENLRHWL